MISSISSIAITALLIGGNGHAPPSDVRRIAAPFTRTSILQPRMMAGGPPPGTPGGPGGPPIAAMGGPGGGGPPTAGPPPGTPGGPGGPPIGAGGPGGPPPGGGPPAKSALDTALDSVFEAAFGLLYAFEPEGRLDSSKNLRVLWVRALLASLGKLNDDVAYQLLPETSRWIVGKATANLWPDAVTEKLSWIVQRTEWIDSALDDFIAQQPLVEGGNNAAAQVVLVGSGYDTRALRYAGGAKALSFFEVDLPSVVEAKAAMGQRRDAAAAANAPLPKALACDLNEAAGKVFTRLESELGFDPTLPTLVVVEAVLFYLAPPAKSKLLGEVSELLAAQPASKLVLTDNLAPFVRGPMRPAAEAYLSPMGLKLDQHDTLWGGAIQFVVAEAGTPAAAAPAPTGGP